jgi:hypothetical protein
MVNETPSKALRVSIPKRWLPMLAGAAGVLLLLAWYAFSRSGALSTSAPAALAAFSARALSAGAAFFSKHMHAEFAVEADELVGQARVYRGRHVLRTSSKFQLRPPNIYHSTSLILSQVLVYLFSHCLCITCPSLSLSALCAVCACRTIDVFESERSGHILLLNHSIEVVEAEQAAHHELMVNVAMSYLPGATR